MNPTQQPPDNQPACNGPARTETIQPGLSSEEILRGQKAVEIRHNGLTYKLQATRLGKLILTK